MYYLATLVHVSGSSKGLEKQFRKFSRFGFDDRPRLVATLNSNFALTMCIHSRLSNTYMELKSIISFDSKKRSNLGFIESS
jgi:hypothetical protein